MDSGEFRTILSRSGVGIWAMIDAAIGVASSDYGEEFRRRRDGIIESLYAPAEQLCQYCGGGGGGGDRDHRFNNRSDKIDYSSDDIDHKDNNYDSDKKVKVDNRSDKNLNGDFGKASLTPESDHRSLTDGDEEDDVDPYGGLFDDEQTKLLSIKEQLENPHQVFFPSFFFMGF